MLANVDTLSGVVAMEQDEKADDNGRRTMRGNTCSIKGKREKPEGVEKTP